MTTTSNTTATFIPTEPVTFKNKAYPSFTLRRVKLKDIVAGERAASDTERSVAIFASMAGVPTGALEQLDMVDFIALATLAEPLLDAVGITTPA